MSSGPFRVVLTGQLVTGFSREAVVAALARRFETSAGTLVRLFDQGGCPIDADLTAEEAAGLQEQLEQIGAMARIERTGTRPSHATRGLRLPHAGEAVDAGLMTCPACGHRQLVARQCDECGVVFAEFNRARRTGGSYTPTPVGAVATPRPRAEKQSGHRPAQPAKSAYARNVGGWHDAWVDDGNELPTEQYHINLFMGHNAGHLSELCQRMIIGPRTQLRLSWTGGAVISPFLWVMYRKMWVWSAVIFVAEVLLPVILIALGTREHISDKFTYLGIAGVIANRLFWPFLVKYLYCRHARNAIAYLNRMSPTYAADIDIAAAGGASRTSIFVGVVMMIVVSLLTWNVVETVHRVIAGRQPVFAEPPPLPGWPSQPGAPAPGTPAPLPGPGTALDAPPLDGSPAVGVTGDAALNKWVITRSRMRSIGQRLFTSIEQGGAAQDPAQLTMDGVAVALSLDANERLDGWGNPIVYRLEDGGFMLASPGPDGAIGSNDDIEYRRSLPR
ncbi:MAG: DUF2628 domain-containing protein [Chromatiaceae bacterium]|nr:DUF2628 domain-containing protein [Gammaproteobacteria bacterium]MCP5300272.1 DUF2628 domain-containing protein [Chromatiaceae bacterium]MCP5422344.1 DUF2628 domain-containing protein [Chromatiaceae bacterium]